MKTAKLLKTKEDPLYFRINPKPHMLFQLEYFTLENGKPVVKETHEPTYLQIVIDKVYHNVLAEVNNK